MVQLAVLAAKGAVPLAPEQRGQVPDRELQLQAEGDGAGVAGEVEVVEALCGVGVVAQQLVTRGRRLLLGSYALSGGKRSDGSERQDEQRMGEQGQEAGEHVRAEVHATIPSVGR